ncbi:hypothetical protein Nizo1840_0046 [Lactiplantibacillus plantarum]|nr:hypothetical protein Nizo1840_0046 [Lactiplantibacillus plantarum]
MAQAPAPSQLDQPAASELSRSSPTPTIWQVFIINHAN